MCRAQVSSEGARGSVEMHRFERFTAVWNSGRKIMCFLDSCKAEPDGGGRNRPNYTHKGCIDDARAGGAATGTGPIRRDVATYNGCARNFVQEESSCGAHGKSSWCPGKEAQQREADHGVVHQRRLRQLRKEGQRVLSPRSATEGVRARWLHQPGQEGWPVLASRGPFEGTLMRPRGLRECCLKRQQRLHEL